MAIEWHQQLLHKDDSSRTMSAAIIQALQASSHQVNSTAIKVDSHHQGWQPLCEPDSHCMSFIAITWAPEPWCKLHGQHASSTAIVWTCYLSNKLHIHLISSREVKQQCCKPSHHTQLTVILQVNSPCSNIGQLNSHWTSSTTITSGPKQLHELINDC